MLARAGNHSDHDDHHHVGHHNHTSAINHPCAAPVLWGGVLAAVGLLVLVAVTTTMCKKSGVQRLRRRKQKYTGEKANHAWSKFWYLRLETAGLMILTVAVFPIFISYARHEEGNVFWLLSSTFDLLGMFLIVAAFVWSDEPQEMYLGFGGGVILVLSDILAAYAASLIGINSFDTLGVVLLWFSSALASMVGCAWLALCYLPWPCGPRAGRYCELLCLLFFAYSALLEIGYGFCPVESSSPNFFGSAGVFNLLGYLLCFAASFAEDWPPQPLHCRLSRRASRQALLPTSSSSSSINAL